MSTKTTTTACIDVQPVSTSIQTQEQHDIATTNTHAICTQPSQEISARKREYSIVGDAFYPSIYSGEVPTWLSDLIDARVDTTVQYGLTDYHKLVQDIRNAIDSIDVAKNTYVEEVSFNERVDGIVGVHLDTLNATFEDKFATIVNLDIVEANAAFARATQANDLKVGYENYTDARITSVQQAYADADSALADDITALTVRIRDQEGGLSATADALTGIQTYVGIDPETSYPNGTGMLSRINILEKQNDGVVEFISGTHDVMIGIENPNNNTDNDQLDVTKEPYASWIAEDTAAGGELTRAAHVGDVYIQYEDSTSKKSYLRSFKFIKSAVDTTSPYSTDPEGYTWALVTDTDAQAAYALALEAKDMADGKRRVFLEQPVPPYDAGDLWVRSDVVPQTVMVADQGSVLVFSLSHWKVADKQLQDFVENTYTGDSAQIHRQLDGKIEYFFYESYTDIAGASDESEALAIISSGWTTQEARDEANGNVVYFKDSTNAYWYQASTPAWVAVTDTSIYQSLKKAAEAKGAADGKVSQFYAWGGASAPADYEVVVKPRAVDPSDGTTVLQEEVKEWVSAEHFLYWFKPDKRLFYNVGTYSVPNWIKVPNTPSDGGVYISEGDIVTVFDPEDGDTTVYSYNGVSWQLSGPKGILSKSKWFVDLDNAVYGPNGHVASAMSDLAVTSSAYTDSETTKVENKFSYDSVVAIDGKHYNSGFGLNTTGTSSSGSGSANDPFDSEFWINAERLVLKSPSHPGVSAAFKVTNEGITLGLEHTEATKNVPRGAYSSSIAYRKGDIVTRNGSSYVALQDLVAGITPVNDNVNWQLLAAKGPQGPKGADGINGAAGADGVSIVWKGSYASHPANPQNGWAYKNTSNGISYVRQSGAWYVMAKDGQNGLDGINGVDGNDGVSIVWKGTSANPPSNPVKNWAYRDTDNGLVYIYTGYAWTLMVADGNDGADGASGADGESVYITYHNSSPTIKPSNPTGDGTLGGWTTVPSSKANWISQKVASSATAGVWSDPILIAGRDGYSNLLRASDHWVVGTSGSQGVFSQNGDTSENRIILAAGPLGPSEPLWEADGVGNNGDGGWNATISDIDHTKTYRSCVWMKQESKDGNTVYLGCSGVSTNNLSGTSNTNPYFWAGDLPTENKWYLVVGIIHGSGYTGGETGIAGIYDPVTGDKVIDATEFKNKPNATTQIHRAYRFYATTSAKCHFARPRFEEVNGEEYGIQEILGRKAVDGDKGDKGDPGSNGSDGARGVAVFTYSANLGSTTVSGAVSSIPTYWNAAASATYDNEIAGDTLILTNTNATSGWTHTYSYNGDVWAANSAFKVNGDQIVDGTIVSKALATDIIIGKDATFEGKVELVGSTHKRVSSAIPFGSNNQFIEWFGPANISENNMSEVNAITYLKVDGSAYFGGTIVAGTLTTSTQNPSISDVVEADTGNFGSNGGQIAIACSLSLTNSSGSIIGTCSSLPDPTLTLSLYEYDGVNETLVQSGSYSGRHICAPEGSNKIDSWTLSGSFTYYDNNLSTANRRYLLRATISDAGSTSYMLRQQRLSIVTQEA